MGDIKIGNSSITLKLGSSAVTAAYIGNTLVYSGGTPPTPHDYSKDYLTFVATENGTFTFNGNDIDYSLDSGATWTTLSNGTATPTITAGSSILWKASGLTPTSSIGIGTFSSTVNFTAEGNIMSLYFGDNFSDQTSLSGKSFAYRTLFSGCTTLTSVENLCLAATTLAASCYRDMFVGCTELTKAPKELPATTLEAYCYCSMFNGCTSLTAAPELPATTLGASCYRDMFSGCTSLSVAPELPATNLSGGYYCYCGMFYGCTSLSVAPELPATTLVSYCYYNMFRNCSRLSSVTCLATDISASNCTGNWLVYVASNGTFNKSASMSSWTSGGSGIPNGWAVQDVTPQTPTYQWVSYNEGDTIPASLVYGVKLYLGLEADNEIDFQDTHQGEGVSFLYSADADGWYGIDLDTSNEIDLSSYYDSSEGCYIVLFSDLGYGGLPNSYPAPDHSFEFDIDLYM